MYMERLHGVKFGQSEGCREVLSMGMQEKGQVWTGDDNICTRGAHETFQKC